MAKKLSQYGETNRPISEKLNAQMNVVSQRYLNVFSLNLVFVFEWKMWKIYFYKKVSAKS